MPTFVKACATSDVAPGTGKQVSVEGKELAVFNIDGTFRAIDNECPHRGGPLAEGDVEGCLVTCPWHAWQFDVTSGESVTDDMKVATYEVKVDGDAVLVAV
jgi:nitrite reductase (NADH) small subunit